MEELKELLKDMILGELFIYGAFSNLRDKTGTTYSKLSIEPILLKDEIKYQFTYDYGNKVDHKNLNPEETLEEIEYLLEEKFRQAMIFTVEADYQVLISKKRKVKIIKTGPTKTMGDLSHNRKKHYILENNKKHDFLIHLGVMDPNGVVIARRYDKFRQINRFLELVADVIPKLSNKRVINIVDFGCGKSYLTFGLYYYLVEILGLKVNIVGLDLKEDVINFCNQVALDLNYKDLNFVHGDIVDYDGENKIDLVVTLHACDTATDAAIVKAIKWDAEAILSVPCCQHELYDKINNHNLENILKHGIMKDRLTEVVTDSLRASILEVFGYETQLVEFIDMEHTHKNILIRGIKTGKKPSGEALTSYKNMKNFWGLKELFIEEEFKKYGILTLDN